MPGSTAILFQTHLFDRMTARRFRKLQQAAGPGRHVEVLMHVPPGTPKPASLANVPHHFVTTPELRNPRYTAKSNGKNWQFYVGHTDLPVMHYWATHPEFDYYWVVEYDVVFTGQWRTFFDAFADNDSDLLATGIRRWSADTRWWHWSSLQEPPSASAAAQPGAGCERIASFMPLFRVSSRALAMMDEAYAEGWGGHCEVTWATVLQRRGARIEDIGGQGEFVSEANRGRFYTATLTTENQGPGTFTAGPTRIMPGLRRNLLWHPVKPIGTVLSRVMKRATGGLRGLWRRYPEPGPDPAPERSA